MLQDGSRAGGGAPGSICLVASELSTLFLNGGIGTYFHLIAHLLARHGWRVHVLYCGRVDDAEALARAPRVLAEAGIGFSCLNDHEFPSTAQTVVCHQPWYLQTSHKIRHALEQLHRVHYFDLIEFADMHAPGFVSVQAKHAGLAFDDVSMLVKLHASSQWLRDGAMQWMSHAGDLKLDYCERYAFEHADGQLSPSRYMLDYMRGCGWEIRDDACAGQPFPHVEFPTDGNLDASVPELVFFGRLETRKGLEVFIDAVCRLDRDVPVTFLGKEFIVSDGTPSIQYLKSRLGDRPYTLVTDYNRARALAYLAAGNRLAIIPSLSETFGYTAAECAVNGIPFVASRVGGIPEIIGDADLQQEILFEPTANGLLRCLKNYLELTPAQRRALRERARTAADVETNNQKVVDQYQRLLEAKQTSARTASFPENVRGKCPLVSVAVTYYNLGPYLPEVLASLAAQTYPNLEVLVIDDGSTCPSSVRVFSEQQALYPQFRFVSQANAGPGAARNRGLAEATGEYFITVDADNVCRPNMVECFARAIIGRPELSAFTCFLIGFRQSEDIRQNRFCFEYCPTGGPHVMASFENVYGDTNAIFRTADLRAVSGYETDRSTPWEDWETFVKMVNRGYRIDVIPELLFYYRVRDDSRLREMTGGWTNLYRPNQHLLRNCFFPIEDLPKSEKAALWTALVSFQKRAEHLNHHVVNLQAQLGHHQQYSGSLQQQIDHYRRHAHDLEWHVQHYLHHIRHLEEKLTLDQQQLGQLQAVNQDLHAALTVMRYRLIDKLNAKMKRVPMVQRTLKGSIYLTWMAWKGVRATTRLRPARLVRKLVSRRDAA